jgi:hypothetical protein
VVEPVRGLGDRRGVLTLLRGTPENLRNCEYSSCIPCGTGKNRVIQ